MWLGEGDQTAEAEEGFLAGLSRVVFFFYVLLFFSFSFLPKPSVRKRNTG